jgi:hypothetical protein
VRTGPGQGTEWELTVARPSAVGSSSLLG